jgi:anti-anti-sigma regulatory factor
MSTATTAQDHIAHELIEGTNHQVVVIDFLSPDVTSPIEARDLGAQLRLLIRPQRPQYFVIDFAGVRSLGDSAFSEILSFVHDAKPVWLCNLDNSLWRVAYLIGLDNWVKCAANRHMAIAEAQRTAGWDEEDSVNSLS